MTRRSARTFLNLAREFLAFAGEHHIDFTTPECPLDRADVALRETSVLGGWQARRCFASDLGADCPLAQRNSRATARNEGHTRMVPLDSSVTPQRLPMVVP